MSRGLIISTRALGRRRPLLDDWSTSLPPEVGDGGTPLTLRALISRIVLDEVASFRGRQKARRFVHVLTARQIEQGAQRGKIDMGGRDLDQTVDDEEAVGAALQAFEDGLYLVIIDEEEHRDLDRQVFLKADSRITFLRLVMLAGG
ncbi:MAG: hypothetical protein JXQ73_05410 [Phycisphaerae bacterium]|nr:hypothetical protein [Phycisphaerae bacterium]